jgi:hypothetical protein
MLTSQYKFHKFLFVCLLFSLKVSSQQVVIDTAALRADLAAMNKDSLVSELRGMLDTTGKSKSFFSANISVSNRLFSNINNALNAQQTSANAAITPSVSYYHKSGFGINATAYFRPTATSGGVYQAAITPSFDHIGDKVMYGLSYSKYLKLDATNSFVTPYDNEIYGYIQERKTWLRPSLTIGWAGGSYRDISTFPIRINGNVILVTDTTKITINDFSTILGFSHSFKFLDVFTSDDMLTIVPQLSIIGGIQQYETESLSAGINFGIRTKENDLNRIRERYNLRSSSSTSPFILQTAAASLNLSWYKGAFSFSGGYFAGYYFQSATSNQWGHIFNISLGVAF